MTIAFARIFPRPGRTYSPIGLAGGRTLPVVDPNIGYLDVELPDAAVAAGNGYLIAAPGATVGPTSSRPPAIADNIGRIHVDTTVNGVYLCDGVLYRSVLTGAVL